MAQLIKLKDYISRYQWNVFRYPSQYIRLKQDNWKKLYMLWDNQDIETVDELKTNEPTSTRSKFKEFIKKDQKTKQKGIVDKRDPLPDTEMELRQYFLNKLYPFQLKWATSTVTDVSFIDKTYYYDKTLKYLLQRYPDIYMVMYYPIFNIKKAPIEGDIILISPIGIEIISLLDEIPETTIMAGDERTWTMETKFGKYKQISPLISLKRTEQIVKSILKAEGLDISIKKVVLARMNNIVFSSEPYNTKIIGKFQYEKWFNKKRKLSSPLKNEQLKVMGALLKHCLTTSVKRPEWEEETDDFYPVSGKE